jgi:GNAT superfamily N-acetyltransferase
MPAHPPPGHCAAKTKLPVRRLTLAVGSDWGAEEHKWRFLFEHGEVHGIDAPDGDGLAGTTVLTRYGTTLAAVSMVLVAARYEGRGLGRRLMTHAIDWGRPLYEKLGFRTIGTVISHFGRLTPSGEPAPAHVRPATADDLPAILALDTEGFGADRGPLLHRLPDFAEHLDLAESPDGTLTGYAAGWRNIDTLVIGPVIADTPVRLDLRTDLPGAERRRHTPFMVALG